MKTPEIVVCGVPFGTPEEVQALKNLKECGVTSVQIYVFWRHIEPEKRGEFDWSYYDRQVKLIQEAGLKWVPFLIFGPPYGFPDWWLKDPHHVGMKCLEHEAENRVESLWNPHWHEEVSRLIKAFAEHYMPWNVLESVQPGICGDYGEAIYPAIGNWPGMYHTHRGFWCMDDCAKASFREYLAEKYGTIENMNKAWRSVYGSFVEVVPLKRHKMPSRTAQFDQLMWYKESMTKYDEFWMEECQKYFPGVPVYMCTGGEEEATLGADFAEQARASAKFGGGIRLTNETNTFYSNFDATAHCEAACKFYGAYMGLEPVGNMIPRGVTVRTFGSAAYGNRQIFHYYGNLFSQEHGKAGSDRVNKYLDLIRERKTEWKVAVFMPLDMAWLAGEKTPEEINLALNYVRRQYECAVINETMIMDGALDDYTTLVMLGAQYTRGEVLNKIAEWIKNGGTLLTNERTTDIEGEFVPAFDEAMGFTKESIYCGGLTTLEPVLPEWSHSFTVEDRVHTAMSWSGLSEDIRPILQTKPVKASTDDNYVTETALMIGSFEHLYGKGRAVYYCASMDLNPAQDSIFMISHAFEHILSDLLREFTGIKPLGTKDDEIARARVDGKILVLKTDEISWTEE